MTDEDEETPPTCIEQSIACRGQVLYRDALSGTGISYARCELHWDKRLQLEAGLRQRYPEHPPPDWSPLDAGESWYEDE